MFTEHDAIIAADVLNSSRAIEVSVWVVRAFVRLREMMLAKEEVAAKLGELKRRVASHTEAIRALVAAIRRLMESPHPAPRRGVGFRVEKAGVIYRARRRRGRAR